MNSVRLLELVREAGVVINEHDELVAIEELVALVERETIKSGSARMDDAELDAARRVAEGFRSDLRCLQADGAILYLGSWSADADHIGKIADALDASLAALTALRAERDALTKDAVKRERRLAATLEALRDLVHVIWRDELLPESLSYMRQARAAMQEEADR